MAKYRVRVGRTTLSAKGGSPSAQYEEQNCRTSWTSQDKRIGLIVDWNEPSTPREDRVPENRISGC